MLKTVIKESTLSTTTRALGLFCSFVLIFIGNENLSKDDLGLLLTSLSAFSFVYLFDFGVGNSARNTISKELLRKGKASGRILLNYLFVNLLGNILLAAIIFLLLMLVGTQYLICKLFSLEILVFLFFAIVFQPSRVVFLATRRAYVDQIIQYSPLIILTVFYLNIKLGIEDLFFIYALTAAIVNFIAFLYISRDYGVYVRSGRLNMVIIKKIVRRAISYILIQSLTMGVFVSLNILVLEKLGPSDAAGFNIVYRMFSAGLALYGALILPKWTEVSLLLGGRQDTFKQYLREGFKNFLLFATGGVVVFFFGDRFIAFLLSKTFKFPIDFWFYMLCFYLVQLIIQELAIFLNGLSMTRAQVLSGSVQLVILMICAFCFSFINISEVAQLLILYSITGVIVLLLCLLRRNVRYNYTDI